MLRRSLCKALKCIKTPIEASRSMSTVAERTIHITFVDSEVRNNYLIDLYYN